MGDVTVTFSDCYDLEAAVSKAGYSKARTEELHAIIDGLRNANPEREVWEPVGEETIFTSHPDGDGAETNVTVECAPDLWGNRQSLRIETWDDKGFYSASIVLPDDMRLCRRQDGL